MNEINTAFIFYNSLNHLCMKDEGFVNRCVVKMMFSEDMYQRPALFDCSQDLSQDLSTHGISSFNIQQNLLSDNIFREMIPPIKVSRGGNLSLFIVGVRH